MSILEMTKFVGVNIPGQSQFTQVSLRINRHHTHLAKQPSYPFRPCNKAQQNKEINHSFNPFSGMLQKFCIHLAHHLQIFRLLTNRLIMQTASAQSKQRTLTALAYLSSWDHYFFEDRMIPSCSEALLQKSTSISRRPIFSYNAFSRLSDSSSGALVSKISAPRDKNSRFQFEIICGWTSKRFAKSLNVSCSLIASMAT